jgi:glycosyltransferase involved in cell wall biosynthesis
MATRNGAKFLREQIDSIIFQLGADDELVISDDSSDDDTGAIARSYVDPRIKFLQNDSNKGVKGNFEQCLRSCAGDYIFLSDQDDVWEDEKINIMMHYLKIYDLVVSDCRIANENLETMHPSFFLVNGSGKGLFKNIFKNSYMGCCMAFNRKVLERSLPFPKNILMHDLWIGLIGELYFKVHFIQQPLVRYRRHSTNASSTGGKSRYRFGKKIIDRYSLIKNLLFH